MDTADIPGSTPTTTISTADAVAILEERDQQKLNEKLEAKALEDAALAERRAQDKTNKSMVPGIVDEFIDELSRLYEDLVDIEISHPDGEPLKRAKLTKILVIETVVQPSTVKRRWYRFFGAPASEDTPTKRYETKDAAVWPISKTTATGELTDRYDIALEVETGKIYATSFVEPFARLLDPNFLYKLSFTNASRMLDDVKKMRKSVRDSRWVADLKAGKIDTLTATPPWEEDEK